jgi:hypothetical protein
MGRPSCFTADDIEIIATMRHQGQSWRAIGVRLGRPNQVCRRVWVETLRNPGGWARPRGPGRLRDRRRRAGDAFQRLPVSRNTLDVIRPPCLSMLEAYL